VVEFARRELGLRRLVAITVPANLRSIALLGKLGFALEKKMNHPDGSEVLLFAREG